MYTFRFYIMVGLYHYITPILAAIGSMWAIQIMTITATAFILRKMGIERAHGQGYIIKLMH